MPTLQYTTREKSGKAMSLRNKGFLPAVFYGPKQASTSISLKLNDFGRIWKEAGESSVITLNEGNVSHDAIIHRVVLHPVTNQPYHVDFYVVQKDKKLEVEVELEFIGISPAVKDLGATLVKVIHDLDVEALPKDLPHSLTVDISTLVTLDDQITAGDIKLPPGVTLIIGADEIVAAVSVAKEEIEETPVSIEDIEVVDAKGKKPGEDEGAEGATEDSGGSAKSEKKADK